MSAGWWALVAAIVVAVTIGVLHRVREGRIRKRPEGDGTVSAALVPETVRGKLGSGVTLVQLSTTFCAPCRHARVLLADLADRTAGLDHVEIDLTERPELAEELRVRRTPTTLAVDAGGHELLRVHGVPKRDRLLEALLPYLNRNS
ncbi:thiol reductase thioredoxin [Longimycelium tulufanense]|uniref:Thiol reductase thioredoxin n=1 Tax=Longimycelium tulufanense TaxID=907463 RepID=A0A8J3CFZ2_9PSEU|nr:thioredoxin family protein [Longimycelium tulufanense]GGM73334.1 thiol reductase thioredoxin [Longimycelium tulufanense]